jgi:hypothetical protein
MEKYQYPRRQVKERRGRRIRRRRERKRNMLVLVEQGI